VEKGCGRRFSLSLAVEGIDDFSLSFGFSLFFKGEKGERRKEEGFPRSGDEMRWFLDLRKEILFLLPLLLKRMREKER
jgi:hypothetical protein